MCNLCTRYPLTLFVYMISRIPHNSWLLVSSFYGCGNKELEKLNNLSKAAVVVNSGARIQTQECLTLKSVFLTTDLSYT